MDRGQACSSLSSTAGVVHRLLHCFAAREVRGARVVLGTARRTQRHAPGTQISSCARRAVLELVFLDRMVNTRGDNAKTVEGRVDARQDGADGDEEGNVLHKRELKGLDETASIQLEGQASRR